MALTQLQRQNSASSEDQRREVLDLAYKEAMARINEQKPGFRRLANKVLSWITCAKRPLTTLELQHALAVEVGDTKLDEDNIERIERIVSVCAGLVTVDKESGIIRLVHYTTQEFFEQMQTQLFPDARTYITTICATYLSFIVFQSGPCLTDNELEERLQINRLYDYAAHNWGYHACEASTLSQAVMRFLENETLVEASTQTLMAFKTSPQDSNYSQRFPRRVTGLHLASYFGIEQAVPLLLGRNGLDSGDSYGRTPLSWAAINNHEHIAKLLLENGAKLEARSTTGETALAYAALNGHGPVVMLLLSMGAQVDARSDSQSTPLLYAARRGHHNVVKILICHGAQIDSRDEENLTPLGWAALGGDLAVVELLLQKGADTSLKDDDGQTPLSRAAANGNHEVVRVLLASERGSLNSTDDLSQTPLFLAAEIGHSKVVGLLLAAKADMDIGDCHGQTPLMVAAKNGQTDVVKMLLEDEAAVGGGKQQWYAFELAVFEGHAETERLLQEKCAFETEDFYGIRALFSSDEL